MSSRKCSIYFFTARHIHFSHMYDLCTYQNINVASPQNTFLQHVLTKLSELRSTLLFIAASDDDSESVSLTPSKMLEFLLTVACEEDVQRLTCELSPSSFPPVSPLRASIFRSFHALLSSIHKAVLSKVCFALHRTSSLTYLFSRALLFEKVQSVEFLLDRHPAAVGFRPTCLSHTQWHCSTLRTTSSVSQSLL